MRLLIIGDVHGDLASVKKILFKSKKIDLILLTGDLGKSDLARKMAFENINRKKQGLEEKEFSKVIKKQAFMESYRSTIKIIKYLVKVAPVYLIFGNVERTNVQSRKLSKEIKEDLPFLYNDLMAIKNVNVINNKTINFKGIKIGGLKYFVDVSWVKEFKPKDFIKSFKDAKKQTNKVKRVLRRFGSLDILLCHQPPYGILDKVGSKFAPKGWNKKHAGSKVLLSYIKHKSPKYFFCGHIHEAEGYRKVRRTSVYNLGCGGFAVIEVDC